jgi:hypothetical protein
MYIAGKQSVLRLLLQYAKETEVEAMEWNSSMKEVKMVFTYV